MYLSVYVCVSSVLCWVLVNDFLDFELPFVVCEFFVNLCVCVCVCLACIVNIRPPLKKNMRRIFACFIHLMTRAHYNRKNSDICEDEGKMNKKIRAKTHGAKEKKGLTDRSGKWRQLFKKEPTDTQ